jgi:cobalamin biosynthesis Mg chelatase CobN
MPEEFKLQLEKQKIEIHKLLAQSMAQNNEYLKDDQHEVIEHLEKRVDAYHQAAQQSLEKNMGALAAGMSELKAQLQAVQKKTAEKTSVKSSSSSDSDSDGGSFMIFVIGLLCGLTVVLSSLAIYNFLSNEPAKTDAAHGAPPADTQGEQAADKHSADVKHDAPAKDKSH